ncbi:hypothetical protein Tco_0755098 [Tanacetum coccineum]
MNCASKSRLSLHLADEVKLSIILQEKVGCKSPVEALREIRQRKDNWKGAFENYETDVVTYNVHANDLVEDEPLLLATTIGRTVPLLPVTPDRAESELEASVDRIFDEGGSGNQAEQGDSVGVGEGANIQPVVEVVAPVQPRRQGKRKSMVVDAGDVSHLPKRLWEDLRSRDPSHHSGPTIAEVEADSLARSSIPIMTTITNVTLTVDPALVAKVKSVKPSLFSADSSSGGKANPHTGVFLDLTGSDFLVGGIRTVIDPDTDVQKVYVPQ